MAKTRENKRNRTSVASHGQKKSRKEISYAERVSKMSEDRIPFNTDTDVHNTISGNTVSIDMDGFTIVATRVANRKYGLSSSEERQAVELFGELSHKWG